MTHHDLARQLKKATYGALLIGAVVGLVFFLLSLIGIPPASGQPLSERLTWQVGPAVPGGALARTQSAGYDVSVTGYLPLRQGTLSVGVSSSITVGDFGGGYRYGAITVGPFVRYVSGMLLIDAAGRVGPQYRRGSRTVIRSRIGVGIKPGTGLTLTVGPTHGVTLTNRWWWGVSVQVGI